MDSHWLLSFRNASPSSPTYGIGEIKAISQPLKERGNAYCRCDSITCKRDSSAHSGNGCIAVSNGKSQILTLCKSKALESIDVKFCKIVYVGTISVRAENHDIPSDETGYKQLTHT